MSAHLFVVLFFWTMIAVGVGIHAVNRDRSGFFWGLVTFLTGLLGVVAYAVVLLRASDGDDAEGEDLRVCPDCSTRHAGSPNYCSDCGEPLGADDEVREATVLRSGSDGYCSNCQSAVDLDADACSHCGAVF